MNNTNPSRTYLKTFFAEKGLDEERVFELLVLKGISNFIPVGVIIINIMMALEEE